MFKKLTQDEINSLINEGRTGYFGEQGACFPNDYDNVIVEAKEGNFLVPKDEFVWNSFAVRLSERASAVITPL